MTDGSERCTRDHCPDDCGWKWWPFIVGLLVASTCYTPQLAPATKLAVVGVARHTLASQWSPSPYQQERAWCGLTRQADDSLVVNDLRQADSVREVSWDAIAFACADGTVPIHTHPRQQCNATETWCITESDDSTCAPSQADQLELAVERERYGIVQCGPTTFALYGPLVEATTGGGR